MCLCRQMGDSRLQTWALPCILLLLGPCPAVTQETGASVSGAAAERMLQSRWLFFIDTGVRSKKSAVAGLCQVEVSTPHGRSHPSVRLHRLHADGNNALCSGRSFQFHLGLQDGLCSWGGVVKEKTAFTELFHQKLGLPLRPLVQSSPGEQRAGGCRRSQPAVLTSCSPF